MCNFIHHTHNGMDHSPLAAFRALSLDIAHSDLGEHLLAVYSGWKLLDNYDTYAGVFVVLFNGFMSLTSYFDVMYIY